jgi:hypothetical protein
MEKIYIVSENLRVIGVFTNEKAAEEFKKGQFGGRGLDITRHELRVNAFGR